MMNGSRICVVLPAYNAEQTLEQTVHELPDLVDIRILVDDHRYCDLLIRKSRSHHIDGWNQV